MLYVLKQSLSSFLVDAGRWSKNMWEWEVGCNGEEWLLSSRLYFHLEPWRRGIPLLAAGSLAQHTQSFTLINLAGLKLCGLRISFTPSREAAECSG